MSCCLWAWSLKVQLKNICFEGLMLQFQWKLMLQWKLNAYASMEASNKYTFSDRYSVDIDYWHQNFLAPNFLGGGSWPSAFSCTAKAVLRAFGGCSFIASVGLHWPQNSAVNWKLQVHTWVPSWRYSVEAIGGMLWAWHNSEVASRDFQ